MCTYIVCLSYILLCIVIIDYQTAVCKSLFYMCFCILVSFSAEGEYFFAFVYWFGFDTRKAVHKKKSVSCPAGGRNCGPLGGLFFFFCLVGKYCPFFEEKKLGKNEKNNSHLF